MVWLFAITGYLKYYDPEKIKRLTALKLPNSYT